ncbi:ras GEF [Martensiomyces pterosporus]|nr:ras GEF [Martensiomyces pterosporus]
MAFYYNQGNRAERIDEYEVSSATAGALEDHASLHNNPSPSLEDVLLHRQINNTSSIGTSGNRRRERLGDTLRIGTRQGIARRDLKLAKIFGEPNLDATERPKPTRRRDKQFYLADIHDPNDLVFNSEGRVSYGTWRGLIMYLTQVQGNVDEFARAFFLTFRSFARPKDLAEGLVARARLQPPAQMTPAEMKVWHERVQMPIQRKVFCAIRYWYENYWCPKSDVAYLVYLCSYLLNEYLPTRHGSAARECQKLLRKIEAKSDHLDLKSLMVPSRDSNMPAPSLRGGGGGGGGRDRNRQRANQSPGASRQSAYRVHGTESHSSHVNGWRHPINTNTIISNETTTTDHSVNSDAANRRTIDDGPQHSPDHHNAHLNDATDHGSYNSGGGGVDDDSESHSGGLVRTRSDSSRRHRRRRHRRNILHKLFTRQRSSSSDSDGFNGNAANRSPSLVASHSCYQSGLDMEGSSSDSSSEGSGSSAHQLHSSRRPSDPEEPDLSDLLMATVGVDLSVEAYRGMSHILQVSPIDVACQLTIIESSCFCQIQPFELLNKEFSRGETSVAKNVRQMTRWCTQITRWVSSVILSELTPEKRCRMLKYFIQLGTQLLALKNYDAVMAVKAAIFCAAVMRLKKTWSLLPKKFDFLCKRLHEAMDPDRNYANYRAILRRSEPPLLPFLGLYLTDLTFLEDGNPTYRQCDYLDDQQLHSFEDPSSHHSHHQSGSLQETSVQMAGQICALFAQRNDVDLNNRSILINFEKSYRVAGIILEIQKFQIEYSGNFTIAIPGLQQYLIEQWDKCEAEGYDDDKIYSMSLEREPRVAAYQELDDDHYHNHQSMQAAMRLTRLLPGATRLMSKDSNFNPSDF